MSIKAVDDKLDQIRKIENSYLVNIGGLDIEVTKGTYPTSELSSLMIDVLDDSFIGLGKRYRVLDYGSGTGYLSVLAALRGADVTALDINPNAVDCTKKNAMRYQLNDKIDARQSDCFSSISDNEKYEVILAGMPWDNYPAKDLIALSMYDPEFKMRKSLFDNAEKHLVFGGRIFITYSEEIQKRHPIEQESENFTYTIVNRKMIKGVEHYIYMIYPKKYKVQQV